VLGFAKIAGGAPSSVDALSAHLLAMTLPRGVADLARYYSRGGQAGTEEEREIADLAQRVAAGALDYSKALDTLCSSHLQRNGDIDPDTAERLGQQLGDAAGMAEMAAARPTIATLRPDLHSLVVQGLGLRPGLALDRDQINALLAGRRADGEKIAGKVYAKSQEMPADPKTGEIKKSVPIGSYDFCPTPDKSVSVAWAFARPAEQAMIFHAHIDAARETVAYIAAEIGQARAGADREEVTPGHVGWVEFTHFTARRTQIAVENGETKVLPDFSVPGDPDLHTHCLIPNAVFCDDGRVGSLHTAKIAGFIFEADAFYHARLAQKLREAGFSAEMSQENGAAIMPAVPRDVCDLFSKRTRIGETLAQRFTAAQGGDWQALSKEQRDARVKQATQSLDRKVKGGKDDVADIASWKHQAKDVLGWEQSSFLDYGPHAPALTPEARLKMAYEAALPFLEARLEQKATLKHWDLRTAAGFGLVHAGCTGTPDIGAVTQLMREHGVEQYGERTALVWGQEEGRKFVSVTTELHESQEQEFITLAKAAAEDRSGALSDEMLERQIKASGLDFAGDHGKAQLAMIRRLGTGGRFGVAIASAGAGKSAALTPLTAAWKEAGRTVHGASLAWQQADAMTEAGIDKANVKAFSVLIDAAKAGALTLDRNTVIAVDEFAMLGTRQGLELLRLQARHGFQVVALGDPKQLQAVSAGNIISLARRALGAEQIPEILTTLRQQTDRERQIVGLFREGRAKEALDLKRADGSAEMVPGGYKDAVVRVARLYAERLQATGIAPTVSAPTNADAHRISEAIRVEKRALGRLGADLKWLRAVDQDGRGYDMGLAVGDRVRLFKSTGATFANGRGGTIGRNGSVLEVLGADKAGLDLRNLRTGQEGRVAWSKLTTKAGVLLAYGDVLTVNTSQGSTSNEHIYALPAGSQAATGLQAYSAGTRHRHRSWLVTSDAAENREIRTRRPINDTSAPSLDDKWANVARNFVRQGEKSLAADMLERVVRIRRGSVWQFPQQFTVAEQRTGRGEAPSNGHEVTARRKADTGIMLTMRRAIDDLHQRVHRLVSKQARELQDKGRSVGQGIEL